MGCGGSKAAGVPAVGDVGLSAASTSGAVSLSPDLAAETLAELAANAYCGPLVQGAAGGGKAGPTTAQVVADTTVELQEADQAKAVQMLVELQREEGLAKVLAADGKAAAVEAVASFVNGQAGKGKKRKKLGKAAVDWLALAVELATHNNAAYDLAKELLGTPGFTVNLGGMQLWDVLRDGVRAIPERVGRLFLAPLFEHFKLGEKLGDAVLLEHATFHPTAPQTGAADGGPARLSQRMAVPELFDLLESRCDFDDYASMPERLSLVAVLMLAALVQAHFEDAVKGIRSKLGGWCRYSVKKTKGYARGLVKLYADYFQLPSPRSQWIKDVSIVSVFCILYSVDV